MNEWQTVRIGDHIRIKHGYAFAGESISDIDNENILVTPGNFNIGGGFKSNKFKFFSGLISEEYIFKAQDLIITMTDLSKEGDTLGYPAFIPSDSKYMYLHNQRVGKVIFKDNRFDKRFLYYLLCTTEYRHEVLASATGTSIKHTSPNRIESFSTLVPLIDEQQVIGRVLGALDDKIELNLKMNATLEAMARALFKSWFIDFDPVHAKMAGKQPFGMDAATAALFPSKLAPSALGDIPEGWSVTRFSEIFEIIGGGTPKTSNLEYWGGNIPWFSVVDAPLDSDVFVIHTDKTITQKGVNESSTRILPVGATIISARGTVGKLALVGNPMAMNQSCYGLLASNGATSSFLYFATKRTIEELKMHAHGSVFDTITRDTFDSVLFVKPCNRIIQAYHTLADSMLNKIKRNLFEIEELEKQRDYLLPKLISGEIRIPDVEKFLECI